MKKYLSILLIICVSFIGSSFVSTSEKSIHDFSLKNIDGKMLSLSQFPKAKGFIIIFTCNHCPFAKLYPERLNKLNTKYKSDIIQFAESNSHLFLLNGIIKTFKFIFSVKLNF